MFMCQLFSVALKRYHGNELFHFTVKHSGTRRITHYIIFMMPLKCARVANQMATFQGFAELQLQYLVGKQSNAVRDFTCHNGNIS